MPYDHDIDFGRAAALMDVVQKVASVAPTYTSLSGVAMMELKEMNEQAMEFLSELGRQRLAAEQQAAADLNAKNQAAMEESNRINAEIAERTAASNVAKPIQVMPGEPDPLADINKQKGLTPTGEPSTSPLDDLHPHEPNEPVVRRV